MLLNLKLQVFVCKVLQDVLIDFDIKCGYYGLINYIDIGGDWGLVFFKFDEMCDVLEWKFVVVFVMDSKGVDIGIWLEYDFVGKVDVECECGCIEDVNMKWVYCFFKLLMMKVKFLIDIFQLGDVVYVEVFVGKFGLYRLCQLLKIQGGMIVMDLKMGCVLVMVGGFFYVQLEFNCVMQVMCQFGLFFKFFVYVVVFDNGYMLVLVVMDVLFELQLLGGQVWVLKNYGGDFFGFLMFCCGIEQLCNLMMVCFVNDMGMDMVVEYVECFGIYDKMQLVLVMLFGFGEMIVMCMVFGYLVIVNGGKQIKVILIDWIQDWIGKIIYKYEDCVCENCNVVDWKNQEELIVDDKCEQVFDLMMVYQIMLMMQGVIQCGMVVG